MRSFYETLSPSKFDECVNALHLDRKARKIAHRVLVKGERQVDVADDVYLTKQRVNAIVQQVLKQADENAPLYTLGTKIILLLDKTPKIPKTKRDQLKAALINLGFVKL